ncbi:MAG: hypothetical protein LBQ46_00150 [Treponema sp.]|jgi:hypothetical protein|nr:hypothetical protein [Treponema sp.]
MAKTAVKAMDLFEAYAQNKLPKDNAYVVSSFVNINTGYVIYEVVSYSGVKAIYLEGNGLTFQSQGKKMHILLEPASYPHKGIEPYLRDTGEKIPLRFSELEILTSRNQIKTMLARKPIESLSSFTIMKPSGLNISFVFYNAPDIYQTLEIFFEKSFNKDGAVPQIDAKKAAKTAAKFVEENMSFKSDFGSDA